jgi:hypothetical protein
VEHKGMTNKLEDLLCSILFMLFMAGLAALLFGAVRYTILHAPSSPFLKAKCVAFETKPVAQRENSNDQ